MVYPDIDPVVFALGQLEIHWYGVTYLLAFASAWWLGRMRARKPNSGWQPEQVDDLLFYGALGVVLGGRIGYILFYGFDDWLHDPLRLFRVWEGGMSFHGGFLGVLLAMFVYARQQQRDYFELTDFIAPLAPLGLLSGRIGNFINGELWGKATDLPWAMQVKCAQLPHVCHDKLGLPLGTELSPPLHPNQLYEGLLEGLVLFLILWLYSINRRPRMALSALFLMGYGVFRFAIEFVRMPDAHLGYLAGGWLTMGQLLSLPMILLGTALMIMAYRKKQGR